MLGKEPSTNVGRRLHFSDLNRGKKWKPGEKLIDTLLRQDAPSKPCGPTIATIQGLERSINQRMLLGDFKDVVSCDRRAAEEKTRKTDPAAHQEKKKSRRTKKPHERYSQRQRTVVSRFDKSVFQNRMKEQASLHKLEGEDKKETKAGDSDTDVSAEEEDEEVRRREFAESILLNHGDDSLSYTYLQFKKYFRYFLATNRQGTLITLIYMRHMNYHSKEVAQAFEASQGTSLLLNLLSLDDPPVQIAAMRVLDKVSSLIYFARLIVHLGGVEPLLNNLQHPNDQMKHAAGKIVGNLCILKKVRSIIIRKGAIKPIVCLMGENIRKIAELTSEYERRVRMALTFNTHAEKELRGKLQRLEQQVESDRHMADTLLKVFARVMCAVSENPDGRLALRETGIVSILATLIPLARSDVLEHVLSTLKACCIDSYFRVAILTEGILPHLLKCLKNSTLAVHLPCTATLALCANEKNIRDGIRTMGGLDTIVRMLHLELKQSGGALENIRVACMARGQAFDEEGFVNSLLRPPKVEPKVKTVHQKVTFFMQKTGAETTSRHQMSAEQKEKAHLIGVQHEKLLIGLTELIWKVSLSPENVEILYRKNVYSDLVRLIVELPRLFGPFRRPVTTASDKLNGLDRAENIVRNCLHAISVAAESDKILIAISRMEQGIKPWVVLLRLAIDGLIPATCVSLRGLLRNQKLLEEFLYYGGLRIVFAYVKTERGEAQIEALRTIEACLASYQEVGTILKPLVNAPEILISFIVSMTTPEATQVAALDTIAQMARDERSLAILSDLGVVDGLARILSASYSEALKISVVRAIASCSYFGKNAEYLGQANCVPMLTDILKDEASSKTVDKLLKEAAVRALYGVSRVPSNVVRIWKANIADQLTLLAGSPDPRVQEAAAGVITNMRLIESQTACVWK